MDAARYHAALIVEVWVAPLVVPHDVQAGLVASLNPAERARAERYRHPDHARRFALARGWLRHVLADACATAPADVPLGDGPGKPRLAGAPEGPCFNVAHAGDLALIAVAEREVGVDVEHVDRGPAGLEATALACTPSEIVALDRLPVEQRGPAFLRLWTAKEAYLKAVGVGLAVAPSGVEIGTPDASGLTPVGGDSGWTVRHIVPAPGYVGAVAAEGRDWEVRLRCIDGRSVEGRMAWRSGPA